MSICRFQYPFFLKKKITNRQIYGKAAIIWSREEESSGLQGSFNVWRGPLASGGGCPQQLHGRGDPVSYTYIYIEPGPLIIYRTRTTKSGLQTLNRGRWWLLVYLSAALKSYLKLFFFKNSHPLRNCLLSFIFPLELGWGGGITFNCGLIQFIYLKVPNIGKADWGHGFTSFPLRVALS